MGLDISAYRKLTKLDVLFDADGEPVNPQTSEPVDCDYIKVCVNYDFPGRADPLVDKACYRFDESMGFRAGSYGGYNGWRSALAALAGYTDEDAYTGKADGKPFLELVNFSDCEGTIGPAVAAKLAADFRDFNERAKNHKAEPDRFYDRYVLWMQAFEMAADGGAVDFH